MCKITVHCVPHPRACFQDLENLKRIFEWVSSKSTRICFSVCYYAMCTFWISPRSHRNNKHWVGGLKIRLPRYRYAGDRLSKPCRCLVSDLYSSMFAVWDFQWTKTLTARLFKSVIHVGGKGLSHINLVNEWWTLLEVYSGSVDGWGAFQDREFQISTHT